MIFKKYHMHFDSLICEINFLQVFDRLFIVQKSPNITFAAFFK